MRLKKLNEIGELKLSASLALFVFLFVFFINSFPWSLLGSCHLCRCLKNTKINFEHIRLIKCERKEILNKHPLKFHTEIIEAHEI